MERKEAVLLNSQFVNKLAVDGEPGWFLKEYNASTGYMWRYRPDNSGVYEVVEETLLHPSTDATGVPGMIIWKFKAIREGRGSAMFELYPPTGKEPVEKTVINFEVCK